MSNKVSVHYEISVNATHVTINLTSEREMTINDLQSALDQLIEELYDIGVEEEAAGNV